MKELIAQVSKDFKITRDEAELIVASLLDQPRFEIYLNSKIDRDSMKMLKGRLMQLRKGVPIEYITKKVQFMNYSLRIYPGVFIPRLETEYFVELIAKQVKVSPHNILEIGTGSGALSIALAHTFTQSMIIATDICHSAINCAQENIRGYHLTDQIQLVHTDMFEGISSRFDLLVSNPPYVPRSRLKHLPNSVKDYEPMTAIDGGKDGVQFILKLITYGKNHLNPDGMIAIEIDEEEVDILKEYLEKTRTRSFIFKKDLFGRFRYLFIELSDHGSSNLDYKNFNNCEDIGDEESKNSN